MVWLHDVFVSYFEVESYFQMIDVHYTPVKIARMLLGSLPKAFKVTKIVDFSAGDGALLREAERIFPRAEIFYNDIDIDQAKQIKENEDKWVVSCSDFTNVRSVAKAHYSAYGDRSFDLILLNPPFSQRGLRPLRVDVMGKGVYMSVALTFIVRALKYLTENGYLLAVLPLGCFDRRIDRDAWAAIKKYFSVATIADLDAGAFPSASARTRLIKIGHIGTLNINCVADAVEVVNFSGKLARGTFQMHNLRIDGAGKRWPLIHTSNLRKAKIVGDIPEVSWHRTITGPALLFPRVGKISIDKLCALPSDRTVVISDCIFAITCRSERAVSGIRKQILEAWPQFIGLYGGTGAPYTTKVKIEAFFAGLESSPIDRAS